MTFPTTYFRVSVQFVIASLVNVTSDDERRLFIVFFVGCFCFGTEAVLLMDMVLGIPFSSLVMTRSSTYTIVKGAVVCGSGLLYHAVLFCLAQSR